MEEVDTESMATEAQEGRKTRELCGERSKRKVVFIFLFPDECLHSKAHLGVGLAHLIS